jgi:uncharacterized membrane protein YeaQ/YmgE (transglycosylase-associated protein family)
MRAKDIFLAVFVVLIFILLFFVNVFLSSMNNMQRNWAVYRCNPMFMPFASYFGQDPLENFTYCIQNMQSSYMDYILQPITYSVGLIGDVTGSLLDDVNSIRGKMSSLVNNISGIVGSILGIFVNMILQMQKILIKLKDTFMKLVGTLIVLAYSLEGAVSTGESVMAGPIGGALRFVCFHPRTHVKIDRNVNGMYKHMIVPISNVEIGDYIYHDDISTCISKTYEFTLTQREGNEFYRIDDILVTAHHKMLNEKTGNWVYVKDHPDAKKTMITADKVYCFETTTGKIPISGYLFHDWEDDNV